ncbi:MAG TPA: Uma2 family endonuclease [Kofleriaceae bacterium]|jgi:Uma2 family endonuclease
MQVFVRQPDETILTWLEERRRNGLDRWDEVWNGVLHVVPPPSYAHQSFGGRLFAALRPVVSARGFDIAYEVGVFLHRGKDKPYRVPDLAIASAANISERGIEARAEIVIELLSPDDKSREKFGSYAECGIDEVWLVDPMSRAIEIYVLRVSTYERQDERSDGTLWSPSLQLALSVVAGPLLRLEWATGATEI